MLRRLVETRIGSGNQGTESVPLGRSDRGQRPPALLRALVFGCVCVGLLAMSTGCQTTIEEYNPPAPDEPAIPVDPHQGTLDPSTSPWPFVVV
jgi:hypothetical protein